MSKKFIILIGLAFLLLCTPAFARSLFYADNPSTVARASGDTLIDGTLLVTGQCNVQSITISQADTANDYVLVYDALTATGTPKFDLSCGTARETIQLLLNDAEFTTGVFVDGTVSGSHSLDVSIEYTQ